MAMTIHDAKIAIGMLARGDNQHDVAAWFGENQARIVEASQGKFGTTEAAAAYLVQVDRPSLISRAPLHFNGREADRVFEAQINKIQG